MATVLVATAVVVTMTIVKLNRYLNNFFLPPPPPPSLPTVPRVLSTDYKSMLPLLADTWRHATRTREIRER